jgi:hypothetical protein
VTQTNHAKHLAMPELLLLYRNAELKRGTIVRVTCRSTATISSTHRAQTSGFLSTPTIIEVLGHV